MVGSTLRVWDFAMVWDFMMLYGCRVREGWGLRALNPKRCNSEPPRARRATRPREPGRQKRSKAGGAKATQKTRPAFGV